MHNRRGRFFFCPGWYIRRFKPGLFQDFSRHLVYRDLNLSTLLMYYYVVPRPTLLISNIVPLSDEEPVVLSYDVHVSLQFWPEDVWPFFFLKC